VDTLIVIPNERLCEIYGNATLKAAFNNADNVLYEAAKAVSDIITITGLINVDFADVKTVMQNMGYALMGTGIAEGENRAINAARLAISNPLLSDVSLAGCQSLLLNVTCGEDILMNEFADVSNVIVNETGKSANIIMGAILDPNMTGKISVTIIATGLDKANNETRFWNSPATKPLKKAQKKPLNKPTSMKISKASLRPWGSVRATVRKDSVA
jgi:cell division protein FtsZ